MANKKKETPFEGNRPIAIIATFLIVCGIAAVVYYASVTPRGSTTQTSGLSASVAEPVTVSPSTTLLFLNDDAATLLRMDGKSERVDRAAFASRYVTSSLPVRGADPANGSPVYLYLPMEHATKTPAIPSPDRSNTAWLGPPQRDGAEVLLVSRNSQPTDRIVLRESSGRPLKDADFYGWFDGRTAAVIASATSVRWIYAVPTDGNVRQIGSLPDDMLFTTVQDRSLWYTTAVKGEGLESPPTGPSEVHVMGMDGKDRMVVREEKRAIMAVTVGPGGRAAFTTDDGQSYLFIKDSPVSLGKRRPVIFLPDGNLILRDKFEIILFDSNTGIPTKLGTLPEGGVQVFVMPEIK